MLGAITDEVVIDVESSENSRGYHYVKKDHKFIDMRD